MFDTLLTEDAKNKLDNLKDNTLPALLKKDENYQKLSSDLRTAQKNYESLNLSKEHRKHIDDLISLLDLQHMEYGTLNYLAGLIDNQKLDALLPVIDTATLSTEKDILKFYYEIQHPCAEQCESEETLKFLKILDEEELAFTALLPPEQKDIFKKLANKQIEGVGYSMADSFVHGFLSCSKLLRLFFN